MSQHGVLTLDGIRLCSPRFTSPPPPASSSTPTASLSSLELIRELEIDLQEEEEAAAGEEGGGAQPLYARRSSFIWTPHYLPNEVMHRILSHLNPAQLARVIAVALFCQSSASQDRLWERFSSELLRSSMPFATGGNPLRIKNDASILEIDRTDNTYNVYLRRLQMAALWPRWAGLGAGWTWVWTSFASLHSELRAGVAAAQLPPRATAVLAKLARYDWVLLYESMNFLFATYAGWVNLELTAL